MSFLGAWIKSLIVAAITVVVFMAAFVAYRLAAVKQVLTEGAPTPHDYLYYYDGEQAFAIRDQRFKYRGPAGVHYGTDQMPIAAAVPQKEWLFDLEGDPGESYDTSRRHPQELKRLRQAFNLKVAEMNHNKRGWY